MKKKAVYLVSPGNSHLVRVYREPLRQELAQLVDLYPDYIDRNNIEQHREAARTAVYAFSTWGMPAFTEEEIQRYFPNLEVVFYAAGSVQGFARPFLNRQVKVVSAWAANGVPVAEYALAQILLANKGFYQNNRLARHSYEQAYSYSATHPGNYHVKVGLLGAGVIGKKLIELLKPFAIDVLVFDPYLSVEQAAELGVAKTSLADIFANCQTISNHLANLPATQGIINREQLDTMLPNATLINTGRGAQIVEADLIAALKAEPGRTAVLDVTDPEPPGNDSDLRRLDNVVLTSHIAGSMNNELARMAETMLAEFKAYERHEPLRYEVSLKMLETMA